MFGTGLLLMTGSGQPLTHGSSTVSTGVDIGWSKKTYPFLLISRSFSPKYYSLALLFLHIDSKCNDFALFLLHFGSEYNVFSLISLYFASKYNDLALFSLHSASKCNPFVLDYDRFALKWCWYRSGIQSFSYEPYRSRDRLKVTGHKVGTTFR